MTPLQLKAIRKKLKLTQRDVAEHIGYDTGTVAKWEQGVIDIPPFMDLVKLTLRKKAKNDKGKRAKQRSTSGK
jgi:DNA-binding transcriptional regulator YiaG